MPSSDELADRLDALEVRIAYQDQIIEDLNTMVTEHWREVQRLTRELALMEERLQSAGGSPEPGADEPPPPHY
jgi:SlyX protein